MTDSQDKVPLKRTALYDLHCVAGARMVPFAGYEMPVQYPDGIIAEHNHVRAAAGVFDVSHLVQCFLPGDDALRRLSPLVAGKVEKLRPGQMRYTQMTNDDGGIIDDLLLARRDDGVFFVLNASRRERDLAHLSENLGAGAVDVLDLGMIALQGPAAVDVFSDRIPAVAGLNYLEHLQTEYDGMPLQISRSGYTGEDGFEISAPPDRIAALWTEFLDDGRVRAAGLGARDTLRLEAGLCLYGNDLDETISPIEAGLGWSVDAARAAAGAFPGAERISREIATGPTRRRIGLVADGAGVPRAGAEIVAASGSAAGIVSSGGFGPTVKAPIAMGYVDAAHADSGEGLTIRVRNRALPAKIVELPFVKHRYARKGDR